MSATHPFSRCLEAPPQLTPSEGRANPHTRSILRAPFARPATRGAAVAARRALRRDLARHPEVRQGGRGLPARAPVRRWLDRAPRPQAIPPAPPVARRAARARLQEGDQLPARFDVSERLVPVEPRSSGGRRTRPITATRSSSGCGRSRRWRCSSGHGRPAHRFPIRSSGPTTAWSWSSSATPMPPRPGWPRRTSRESKSNRPGSSCSTACGP